MTEQADEIRQQKPSGQNSSFRKWAFSYKPGERKGIAVFRSWLRIIFIMIHEFDETAISLRASALTYTIVLSIVPMLAMSTAILKGLGSDNQMRIAAYKFIDQLEPAHPQPDNLIEQNTGGGATGEEVPASGSITVHLRNAVDTIFDYVNRTNFAALGAFGIAGLLVTVVLLLSTVEGAMNAIWHTKEGRSVLRKIMDYLALLILLPISINVALAGDAILESPNILAHLNAVIPSEWLIKMLLKLLPFLFVILSLMVMYLFFPNVRVNRSAAFIGAVFAAFFWFLVQKFYIILQIGVAKYNAIYGSFATLPLFLVWVQLGWTFILLGASLAYAVQNRNLFHLPGEAITPQKNLQIAFDVLNTVYTNFRGKKRTSLGDLVRANPLALPGDIQTITENLVRGGLLHPVDEVIRTFVPASPSENIEAGEIVRLILGHVEIDTVGGNLSKKVIMAAEQAIPADAFPLCPENKNTENIIDDTQAVIHEQNEEAL